MVVVPIVDRIIPPKPPVPVPVVKPVTPVAPATPAPVRPDIVQPVVEQVVVDQGTLQAEETVVPATDAGTGDIAPPAGPVAGVRRSEEHTSELQSLMRISYAVFCLKKTNNTTNIKIKNHIQCPTRDHNHTQHTYN